MAPLPSRSRHSFGSRTRPNRTPRPRTSTIDDFTASEPPPKKRRYIPGGPGGGGRYVDTDGTEIPVGGTGPGGYAYTGPRGRIGRENALNGVQPPTTPRPRPRPHPRRESRRERPPARPRFSSAAAAAAAVVQGDPFKPREERGWEEFHQDLEIDVRFPVFAADEVDGVTRPNITPLVNGSVIESLALQKSNSEEESHAGSEHGGETPDLALRGEPSAFAAPISSGLFTPQKRRPGRPFRRPDSMLKGIGTPEIPKSVPTPGPNPREKLTLPKPAFRRIDPFVKYETKSLNELNFVNGSMLSVGYQTGEYYERPENLMIRASEGAAEEDLDTLPNGKGEIEGNAAIGGNGVGRVEYDMDEQDEQWLDALNTQRKIEQVDTIKPYIFEITMTKIEKEWHALEKRIPKPNPKPPQTHRPRSSSAAAVNGEPPAAGEEQDSKCAICDDGDCENTNAIVFCDGCDLAVHQECYGVPFIPEGQWLCRKCQLIGKGTPTCIFCPNTDGAFKQTNSSRWSHLLCAIWIPEVSLGNTTFMEPVMEVEKVPKQRWKLTCYICRQKMGACIQCGNKNCFVAFHVTCARRAKLFLKMKSSHGSSATFDASVLKAFCDKHVPAEWRLEHDVDNATANTLEYYQYTMRGKRWADRQQAALSAPPVSEIVDPDQAEEQNVHKITLSLNSKNRKRNQPTKSVWKLPSGAPVIPQTLYDSVESSLQRFTVRKRKEFAMEACKYWTLKRESRRGAALLKRLQVQMETFSSMEMTRRNFAGMGAAGRARLDRRISFAEQLQHDVGQLRNLCELTKAREEKKREDAAILKEIVETVYFPITPLLWPALEKAQRFVAPKLSTTVPANLACRLDIKGLFSAGFSSMREKLSHHFYSSVSAFSSEFGAVVSAVLDAPIPIEKPTADGDNHGGPTTKELVADFKDKRKLAKRIVKAVQEKLEDAMRKESELCRRPYEKELRDLDMMLEASLASRRDSAVGSTTGMGDESDRVNEQLQVTSEDFENFTASNPLNIRVEDTTNQQDMPRKAQSPDLHHHHPTPEDSNASPETNGDHKYHARHHEVLPPHEPPTPPLSSGGDSQSLFQGGIPWYMETFDPIGTTIQEERWTGRELAREMSEELSDMDEEELSGLVDIEMSEMGPQGSHGSSLHPQSAVSDAARRKAAAKRRRRRNFF